MRCAFENCPNNSKKYRRTCFRFPKDTVRAINWIVNCNRQDLIPFVETVHKDYVLCGEHFELGSFTNSSRNRLHRSAVPTLFPTIRTSQKNIVEIEHSYACGAIITKKQQSQLNYLEIPSTSTDLPFHEIAIVKKEEIDIHSEELDNKEETIDKKFVTEVDRETCMMMSFSNINQRILEQDNSLKDLPFHEISIEFDIYSEELDNKEESIDKKFDTEVEKETGMMMSFSNINQRIPEQDNNLKDSVNEMVIDVETQLAAYTTYQKVQKKEIEFQEEELNIKEETIDPKCEYDTDIDIQLNKQTYQKYKKEELEHHGEELNTKEETNNIKCEYGTEVEKETSMMRPFPNINRSFLERENKLKDSFNEMAIDIETQLTAHTTYQKGKKEEMDLRLSWEKEPNIKEDITDIKCGFDTEVKKETYNALGVPAGITSNFEVQNITEYDMETCLEGFCIKKGTQDKKCKATDISKETSLTVSDLTTAIILLEKNKKLNDMSLEEYKALAFKIFDNQTATSINKLISSGQNKTAKVTKKLLIQYLKLYFADRIYYKYIYRKPFLPNLRVLSKYVQQNLLYNTNILNSSIFQYFMFKYNSFNDQSKYSVLRIIKLDLKSSLFFNHSSDTVVGLAVDENSLLAKFQLADEAYVLILGGLYSNWQQPLGYFFFSSQNHKLKTSQFLYNLIFSKESVLRHLQYLGVTVNALIVPNLINFDFCNRLGISGQKPYFRLNERSIYLMFNVENILLDLRDVFLKHSDILYSSSRLHKYNYVSGEYIKLLYELDKKNSNRILTRAHMKPRDLERRNFNLVADLFSAKVVSFMNSCLVEKQISLFAQKTYDFMWHIYLLIVSLHKTTKGNDQYKQNTFKNNQLGKVLDYLKVVYVSPSLTAMETNLLSNLNCLKLTLKSLIELSQHIRITNKELNFNPLDTSKFSLNINERFFKNIYKNNGKRKLSSLTPIKFHRAFKKIQTHSLLHSGISNCRGKFKEHFDQLNYCESDIYETNFLKVDEIHRLFKSVKYQTEIPLFEKNRVQYVLQKCSEFHSCDKCSKETPTYYKELINKFEKYFQDNFEDVIKKPNVYESMINSNRHTLKEPNSNHTDFYMMCLYFKIRIFVSLKAVNTGMYKKNDQIFSHSVRRKVIQFFKSALLQTDFC